MSPAGPGLSKIPNWSMRDHVRHCLPTTPSPGLISADPMEGLFRKIQPAGASFAVYYLARILMSGKPLQENNSLLRRRALEMVFCSSAKAFLLAGICLWCSQPKYGKQNLKITPIRNWFLKQVMSVSWQSSNEFSSLSLSNPVVH